MNAAVPTAVTGHHQYIPLAKLTPSPLNHRKIFDEAKMKELADSVSIQGVIQPILVRPLPGDRFEVVAGERRYRASKMAKRVDVPAIVRELSDVQVLELQVIENGQRVDPHPLEEAEGYEALLACPRADGSKYTVDEIAAKVGKSKAFVYARLKLCALGKTARAAFYKGQLDASRALLLARIPVLELQDQAFKEITGGEGGDEYDEETGRYRMSYREAARHVHDRYMLQLKSAPFNTGDAQLLPKAGACGPCPKRTGNQAELFGDVKSGDVCTDPKCYGEKKAAHGAKLREAAEASGKEVIAGAAAKKLMPNQHSRPNGYLRLADTEWIGNKQKSFKQLLGKDCPPTVLIENPHNGELQECVRESDAKPILKTKIPKADAGLISGGGDTYRDEQKKRKAKAQRETAFRERIHGLLRAKIEKPGDLDTPDLAAIALAFFEDIWHEHRDRLAKLWMPDGDAEKSKSKHSRIDKFEARIKSMTGAELERLLLDLAVITETYVNGYDNSKPERLYALARARKINVEKERKAYDAELKEAKKAKTKPKAKKDAKAQRPAIELIISPLIKTMDGSPLEPGLAGGAKKKVAKKKREPMASFMKPMKPSPELAAITGPDPMARTEVTSKVWGYIKKHELQDKVNRRMINLDATLQAVMGAKKQISMFEMTKCIAKHLS